ncbi:4-hydroxy-tetrahydrodipicolinate reductase [Moraxella sp. K127]|nr:4-hydroxy-tetrahydrodipicolinate reductase [Moraxella lacunata]MBE9590526.1 4-hydroxy-tetrahydrodipicolinate reductase [Moraxella sp. K127]MDI4484095.1 4-hydroxy-tetrahydrodipicolinate reductase [Moraxella lacunata]
MMALNIAIMGASGRMGRMLIQSTLDNPKANLAGAFVRSISSLIGVDAGEFVGMGKCGVTLSTLDLSGVDVLIDFSLPDALDEVLEACIANKVALVMGVTGLDEAQEAKLHEVSKHIPIVYAGNYSTGVNLSLNLLAITAKVLGMDADVEIIEHHHKHKLDAPSGTALMMANAVADARGQTIKTSAIYGRQGQAKRADGEIGIHAVRGGEIVGEHTVEFIMNGEIIEITHKAQSRMTFANGAVRAGLWLHEQPAQLYDMQDVLGLK